MILLSEVKCYEFAIKPKEWENQDNKAVGNSLGMLRHDAYVECYHLYEFGECYHHHQVHEPQDKLTEELPNSKKRKICQLLIDQETIKKRYIFEGKTQLHMPRNLIIHVHD